MRGKNIAVAVAVLAVAATPAAAHETNALRSVPRTVTPTTQPAASPAQPTVARPAVWIPSPSRGIKWSSVKYAVWIR